MGSQHREPQLTFEHDLALGRPDRGHGVGRVAGGEDVRDHGVASGDGRGGRQPSWHSPAPVRASGAADRRPLHAATVARRGAAVSHASPPAHLEARALANPWSRWTVLVVFLVVAGAAGFVGNLVQGSEVGTRYLDFERPPWAPPQEAFGIVWPVLYVLIGIAGWRLWRTTGGVRAAALPLGLWALQLVVNAVWPGVFFGLEEFGWAVPVIVLLDVVVIATIVVAARVDRWAAALLAPYLAWILYATALNVAIWQLN
ncbi:tryptophan-rich sensory protein [Nitriliruptoraceae bacterium ZYF776]|nr:tryptophan-rich sensory protein [Profundirhabdus halotolerans]